MQPGNELRPRDPGPIDSNYQRIVGPDKVRRRCADYLHDESRLGGDPVEIVHLPTTTAQVAAAVRNAARQGHRVTVSGGRTGIVGGAVPRETQELVSLERLRLPPTLRRRDGGWTVRVGAGTTVEELDAALRAGDLSCPDGEPDRPLFYPVDTTERSAQIGGTIATNASGARTLHYGPTRRWVEAVTVVTPDGRVLELRRGQVRAREGELRYIGPEGDERVLRVPDLPLPSTKHTAGYHLASDMDAVDLFVGSEGTLGVITEAELRLAEKPTERLFLTVFLPSEEAALAVTEALRDDADVSPLALEYFGPKAIDLLREQRAQVGASSGLVTLPEYAGTALYAEFDFSSDGQLDRLYQRLMGVLESLDLDPERTWAAFTEREMEQMKELRHAVPEAVNTIIGRRQAGQPELHKVGTDMAVPPESLRAVVRTYRELLDEEGLDYVIFGHVGDAHLHVNILPETVEQVKQAEELYLRLARRVVRLNGSVAAEHGIGRIKIPFLRVQYGPGQIEAMRRIKETVDPAGTLNPGVLFAVDSAEDG